LSRISKSRPNFWVGDEAPSMPNVVMIMNDSLRRDHVGAYGLPVPWARPGHDGEPFIHTPNLDRFAAESAVFDRFYVSSYPTVPCRYDLFSGRYGFPTRGWQPLEPGDVVMSELVARAGRLPMLVYDTPMLGNDSYNYTRGFAGIEFLRGQHVDRWNVDPIDLPLPCAPHKLQDVERTKLYLRNTAHRRYERDWMCGQTVTAAMDWLERNRKRDGFVLWIDMWDPHEPFDAPDFDLARYADPAYQGEAIIYPRYGRGDYMSEEERNHVRALYAGLVTCVDRWVGRLLEKIETVGLARNTLVVHLTDHGHLFGDHDLQGKPSGPYGRLYEPTTRVPLMIRHPDGLGAGQRIGGLAQHPDLLPTVLEFIGVPAPPEAHGRSLWPLITGEAAGVREFAFSGRMSRFASAGPNPAEAAQFDGWTGGDHVGEPVTITSEEWSLICPPGTEDHALYHLPDDPGQTRNVIADHPDRARRMHQAFIDFMTASGAPAERIRLYTEPQPRLSLHDETELFAFQDPRGLWLAFRREADARALFSAAMPAQEIRSMRFGELRALQPRALVLSRGQYYRAEDVAS
jgi:arylsulfatase A-like enzyme